MTKMWRPLLLAVASVAAAQAAPAWACTVTRTAPRDPAVRYAGTDVRRVIGTYRLERVAAPGTMDRAMVIHGRLTTRRGTYFDLYQFYRQQWVDCLIYDLPVHDASGTFYLSRHSNNGRYQLLGWSGEYVSGNGLSEAQEEDQH
jgi:hypothetical protein